MKTSPPWPAGCDALAVYLIIAQIGGTLDVGPGTLGVVGTLAIMIPWIAAQWEEYHSGLMLYGNGVVGITEVWLLCLDPNPDVDPELCSDRNLQPLNSA